MFSLLTRRKACEVQLSVFLPRYQEELPAAIASRPDKYVTQSELVKLMEWKLTVSISYTQS